MMTSKGTSRLMTTWTGATSNKLTACALVLGNPSSSQLWSADDKRCNSEPIAFNMSSSGTSCPLETNLSNRLYKHVIIGINSELTSIFVTYLFTWTPISVFSRIMFLKMSPLDTWSMSNARTMRSDTVPLPEPGAPMIRARRFFVAAAIVAEFVPRSRR